MDIEQIYNDCYTLYERNLENTEIKEKIEKILFEIDEIYWHAQNELRWKFLEIKKLLDNNL